MRNEHQAELLSGSSSQIHIVQSTHKIFFYDISAPDSRIHGADKADLDDYTMCHIQ